MIMALTFPELIAVWAMRQRLCARRITTRFKASELFCVRYPQEQSEISSSSGIENAEVPSEQHELKDHEDTRALVAHVTGYEDSQSWAGQCKKWLMSFFCQESEDYAWTQTHSIFVLMGGFMLYVDDEPYHTLSFDNFLKMSQSGHIDVPKLTANQIRDKSKGDMISKGLAILQIAWFVLQLISRKIYHLETTQLEAGTLAFAVLSFITYAMWWNKPLNVQCPHPVYWKLTGSKPEDSYFDDVYPGLMFEFPQILHTILDPLSELLGVKLKGDTAKYRVPTFDASNEVEELDKIILLPAGLIMITVFGGIHCIAWSFAFPTYREQVVWRMSTVTIIFAPWLGLFASIAAGVFVPLRGPLAVVIGIILGFMYSAGRGLLLILMAATLRNLPPGAYEAVSWTSLVPHW
ncbi:hypothetical protein M405DRAFT_782083 [Rhizopogon salebrosus TDB-379]|nr:hypothetical protein M405DRAFT_782083 [Rhizopogon salebrosus TDB-379]